MAARTMLQGTALRLGCRPIRHVPGPPCRGPREIRDRNSVYRHAPAPPAARPWMGAGPGGGKSRWGRPTGGRAPTCWMDPRMSWPGTRIWRVSWPGATGAEKSRDATRTIWWKCLEPCGPCGGPGKGAGVGAQGQLRPGGDEPGNGAAREGGGGEQKWTGLPRKKGGVKRGMHPTSVEPAQGGPSRARRRSPPWASSSAFPTGPSTRSAKWARRCAPWTSSCPCRIPRDR